ncbi:cytochrome b-c1 complex subunit 8 [Coprinopsis sp. MPI-PUGE-AT-0042]|nr:cytochrome b-c1 complex subunit 8 [Coprinopsis sp. MPI-PUGE-AT-0042]KAH6903143.1 cytochrome b-c1 complex subunit 8 [Coprinopsis sp. MPI-PUGE-AT-0042]
MRPTAARMSDMPGGKVYNLWWGDRTGIRQKGITTYSISPWQTKAAPGWAKTYLFNFYRRIGGELIFWGIPFGIGYATYSWAKSYDAWQNSKAGHLALSHDE